MKKQADQTAKVDKNEIYKAILPKTLGKPAPAKVQSGYLPAADATALFDSLKGINWDTLHSERYPAVTLLRRTKTYYEGDLRAATAYMNAYGDKGAIPIPFTQAPQELQALRKRLQAANPGDPLSVCYINYYYSGRAGIAWHQDREEQGCPYPMRMATVYGHSKGKTRNFCVLQMDGKLGVAAWEVPTNHGDLIETPIGFHDNYFHAVLPEEKSLCRPRISLTFRNVDLSSNGKWFWYKSAPQVWDCHAGKVYPPDAVYVGCKTMDHGGNVIRVGSPFGNAMNPLQARSKFNPGITNDYDNPKTKEKDFRAYAIKRMKDPAFRKQVETLQGKHLLCWCVQRGSKRAPFCHARIWLELANPPAPKEWALIQYFLTRKGANKLYKRLVDSADWIPNTDDHPMHAFRIAYGKSYDKSSSGKSRQGGRAGEIRKIPNFLRELADAVSAITQCPVNYIQCHKYGSDVAVRPHKDPGGMVVPMLVVGQERTFRVGGTVTQWANKQIDRKVEWHVPAEEYLLTQGSLLIFNGGRTYHSMFPTKNDPKFRKQNRKWRISIIFRWTTDIIRQYGPGAKGVKMNDYKKAYDADVKKWRAGLRREKRGERG